MDSLLIGLLLTITTNIYQLESSGGKYDSCRNQGLYNGYGYASNKVCFETHAEAEGVVANWVQRQLLLGYSVPQVYCYYQSGKHLNDCDYAKKAAKL